MRSARWLSLYDYPRTAPLTRRALRAVLDVAGAIALIFAGAALIAALLLYGLPRFIIWTAADVMLDPPAPVTAERVVPAPIAECLPPTEHELLLVSITIDEGGNLQGGCKYVGPRGGYSRSRHGMPEPRP